ncbi:uncharacterized protein LOC128267182 [Anopheles cruzii]|uniref:uncharacterized protein LOC128267182 n=1 Tax=Anopheles cruzii TaxID=68878 RepID=UPI0022EC8E52|nr:uncharacterized protein LOC128267182 [Anopheles cruzii]
MAHGTEAQVEGNCFLKTHDTSCDNNKLRYSVVVDGGAGDKFIINHSVERVRVPTTTPVPKYYRMLASRKDRVAKLRSYWKTKTSAVRDRMAVIMANKKGKLRRERLNLKRGPLAVV